MNFLKKFIHDDKSFYKAVVTMTVPILLQNLITMGVNLADNVMIGRLGETVISGASLSTQFVNTFQIFCMGTCMGASVLASRFWGMKDLKSMHKVITIMFRVLLVLTGLFTIATAFFPETIMRIYTNEEPIIEQGVIYFKYAVASYIFHGLALGCTIILRCVRQVKVALTASIVTFFFNIGANYILIFGKLGFPAMGIAGASIATLIARIIEFAMIFGYFFFADKQVNYRIKSLFTKCGDLFGEYVKVSVPVIISDGLMAFGINLISMIVGRMGESFIAANAIVSIVVRLLATFATSIGHSSAVIVGNTLGEGKIEEVKKQGYAFFGLAFALGLAVGILVFFATEPVIAIYKLGGETKDILRQMMLAMALIMSLDCSANVLTKGVLRGGGDTKMLMFGDCFFQLCITVPISYVAGLVLHLPPFWVYVCLKLDYILKCVWSYFRMKSGKWIKKVSDKEEAFSK